MGLSSHSMNELAMISRIACLLILVTLSCTHPPNRDLQVVTYGQFEEFIQATGYCTEAEEFGWSIVNVDVFNFHVVEGANWKKPDGIQVPPSKNLPVTQVSYNDAMAYCAWSQTRLPSYAEYWDLVKEDNRMVITNYNGPISEADQVNILGNVWEITSTFQEENVRLAGGSLFCAPNTCHGTMPERRLYVDRQTGNVHIGFAVLKK